MPASVDTAPDDATEAAARLTAWFQAEGPLVMDEADLDDVQTVLAGYKRLLAEREPLRPEYGMRVTYTSTLTAEGAVADTERQARAMLDRTKRHRDVVSAELIQRPVGDWRAVGDEHG